MIEFENLSFLGLNLHKLMLAPKELNLKWRNLNHLGLDVKSLNVELNIRLAKIF